MSLFFWLTGGVVWCLLFQIQHYLTLSGHTWKRLQGAPCFLQIRKNLNLPIFFNEIALYIRMHSSRMHTAHSSSHLGGLHQAPPWTRTPWDQTPPRTRPFPEAGTNLLGPDPPRSRNLPQEQAPLLWTESQTPVKILPSCNFICGQ